jgi:hypothetical protein
MATFKATKTASDVKKVAKRVRQGFANNEAAAFALASSFAVKMLNQFREDQKGEKYWKNQSEQAFRGVFTGPFRDSEGLGFFIAHGVDYGVYLELANNRKNAALRPLAKKFVIPFRNAIIKLYAD